MMNSIDVITFGEAMAMFISEEVGELHSVNKFTKGIAGAEFNVSVGLARLGLRVRWISKVGDDPFGRFMMETLQKEGIDSSHVVEDKRYPTGFQLKSRAEEGDPIVHYFRKGSAASTLTAGDLIKGSIQDASHLHFTGIPPALSESMREAAHAAVQIMRKENRSISFDPNLRPGLWSSHQRMVEEIQSLAVQADWVLPGISEGEILTGYTNPRDIADFYLDKGVKAVAVKLGPQGAYYKSQEFEGIAPGYSVHPVDTVGAGDGFAVGVISGLLEGRSLHESVQRGNAIGALAVTVPGDFEGLPTKKQLESFMSTTV